MPKLTNAAVEHIKGLAERIPFGKITIVLNENMSDVDIVVEERARFAKEEEPRAGKIVTATKTSVRHQG